MTRDNRAGILKGACVGLLALGLSACIPYNRAIAPGIETRLVDAKSGAGIGGAVVTLSVGKGYKAQPRTAVSAPDGSVKIEAIRELIWVMPATDIGPIPGKMRVEAEGYEPYEGQTREKFIRTPGAPGPTTSLTPRTK